MRRSRVIDAAPDAGAGAVSVLLTGVVVVLGDRARILYGARPRSKSRAIQGLVVDSALRRSDQRTRLATPGVGRPASGLPVGRPPMPLPPRPPFPQPRLPQFPFPQLPFPFLWPSLRR